MLEILSLTAPIFILIALGYASVMTRLISQEATRGMGKFIITIALPSMIIRGMANKPLAASIDGNFLMGYGLASITLYAAGLLFYRHVRRASLSDSSMAGLGMSSANTGFIGVSICAMVLGTEPASRGVAMTILVESTLVIPLAVAIADAGATQGEVKFFRRMAITLKGLVRSPLLIAIVIGLLLSALQIPLKGVPLQVIDMLAMAAAPVALFAVGGNLYGLRPKGLLADASIISGVKLILHPALTALAFLFFPGLSTEMRQAGILFAAAPMLSILPILGMRYGLEKHCSATLLLGTVASFLTISATIALIT
ncbi:MAG TPA: AEC family transporter [Burkholderiaceae bacterium]|nr:AEC family transporter [Burkholderiaceae bacterium]